MRSHPAIREPEQFNRSNGIRQVGVIAIWNPDPERIFGQFCDYVNEKLNWSAMKDKEWTDAIFEFFRELTKRESESLFSSERLEQEGEDGGTYMTVDYVVRGYVAGPEREPARKTMARIILAVEHENSGDVSSFLTKEIRHLIDLKCAMKIAITYPAPGDAKDLLMNVQKLIQDSSSFSGMKMLTENYLVIFGSATTKSGKRAVKWEGYVLNTEGKVVKSLDKVIFQKAPAS